MMRETPILRQCLGLCAAVLLIAVFAQAQSLGDYARKQRELKAAKAATEGKAVKVYTNDDLPKSGGLSTSEQKAVATDKDGKPVKEGDAVKEGEAAKQGEAAKEAPKEGEAAKPGAAAKPSAVEEEKIWRDRFAKLRQDLSEAERRLDLYQRELNMANVQFYSNPNQALREQTMRSEINSKTKDIDTQKAAVDAARKTLAAAEEEMRRKNLPPGWAR